MTDYDKELGQITDKDRKYAADLIGDFLEVYEDCSSSYSEEVVAEWLRKVRYEAVIEDRKKRIDQFVRLLRQPNDNPT